MTEVLFGQEADIVALVPKSWVSIIELALKKSNMHDLQHWALHSAQGAPTSTSPDAMKTFLAQHKQHVFQGVPLAQYNLIGMLAKMVALGVIFRPAQIFEHKAGDYNRTHYQREATSKLELFGMTDYKQVLYLDADGLVLQNLDALFNANLTSVALIPTLVTEGEGEQYATRVMLLQPCKAVQAQLQFVVEKDQNFTDARVLSEFFVDQIWRLPANMTLQSYELLAPNSKSSVASRRLQEASYVHLYNGPGFPKHWQWADPTMIPKLLSVCTEMCDERMSWLHVYSMLAHERASSCLQQH